MKASALSRLHAPSRIWFEEALGKPTKVQREGMVPICEGRSALLLAPTGSGKTLAAFLAALDRLASSEEPPKKERLRVLYVSPLKALAVDIEKNLRAPIAGIRAVSARLGEAHREIAVAVRTGDTPARERAQFSRAPADILITTPESLYLLLTSEARTRLASVECVIVDEIHSLAGTKRGAHLFLSLERLEALRPAGRPLQRIGLSATQRPLDRIARLLGGGTLRGDAWVPRPVEIVDASEGKVLDLSVEVPIEDMARLGAPASADGEPGEASIWPSIHPRLVELVRAHRSTMIFVNSRRLAERLAGALNELAGETLALAHHGSVAKEKRKDIEDRLKSGKLPAIVATSSLELGIDMGAVDLVIQIEAPPSVASGIQRIGRAGHQVGAPSRGIIVPKYRGDLLASAAAVPRMTRGEVELTKVPENPLDVLAQQVVAMASVERVGVDEVYELVRRASPFSALPRESFEGVLDMLSGRYPSDEFAELRPRLTWDRVGKTLNARRGAKRLAVVNAGTIPDRGLFGVFLAGTEDKPVRVGELDEEMVFESRPGDVFVLGASSWRIEEITHDRVLVTPAPGEPGRMPFWHGDRPGRSAELGYAMGSLVRELAEPGNDVAKRLVSEHALDARAAKNLGAYVTDQAEATGHVPSDRSLVIERFVDEVGDHRVCLLSNLGTRVLAPLALTLSERYREATGAEIEAVWSDDGIVFRFPESDEPPDLVTHLPLADEVSDLLVKSLGQSSVFAARFRENAARALLLPRRHPGRRSRSGLSASAADLLSVAARYRSFPILLETYRECLTDVFDVAGLEEFLRRIESRRIRVHTVDASGIAVRGGAALFLRGELHLRRRRAPRRAPRAGAVHRPRAAPGAPRRGRAPRALGSGGHRGDRGRARAAVASGGLSPGRPARSPAGSRPALRDRARAAGRAERRARARAPPSSATKRRVFEVGVAGERRLAAAEDVAQLRDALGVVPPLGVPSAFLEAVSDPLLDLVSRYARTHGPFAANGVAGALGIGVAPVRDALSRLTAAGRVVEGELLPGGSGREFCDAEVLRSIKRRSLAKLRQEIEPVDATTLRFLAEWHELGQRAFGPDSLATVMERLQGAPLVASTLDVEILPARLQGYSPLLLDQLTASGELLWRGLEPVGDRDGRIAFYFADQYRRLAPPARPVEGALAEKVRAELERRGASFFQIW
ncbi:MAG: DEAD/DEAH box helicase [Polyangiaceae bacterium]